MAYSASILQTPAPFLLNSPDEWPKWEKHFEQYRVASGLSKEDDERQVSALLYCLGEEADDMLTSTNITSESRKKFADMLQKFDDFFQVRKNVISKEPDSINALKGRQKLQSSSSLPYTVLQQTVNSANSGNC